MSNIDKVSVKGEFFNIVSPSAFGDYIETIGGACTNPSGYAKDRIFLAKTNDVQNLYKATQAISFGANIVVGTNCEKTSLSEVIATSGGASSADQVSYDNSTSGLTADDVQEAIDEVNGKTNTNANNISSLNSALSVYKTGNIIASDAVSVNSSHILRFGKVISIHVDFTVGNTAIPAWDTSFLKIPSAILPEGITGTMQNASTVMQSVLDFTNDVAKLGYVSLAMGASGADKGFFSNRSFLANTRYNIGMTFIIPPTS